ISVTSFMKVSDCSRSRRRSSVCHSSMYRTAPRGPMSVETEQPTQPRRPRISAASEWSAIVTERVCPSGRSHSTVIRACVEAIDAADFSPERAYGAGTARTFVPYAAVAMPSAQRAVKSGHLPVSQARAGDDLRRRPDRVPDCLQQAGDTPKCRLDCRLALPDKAPAALESTRWSGVFFCGGHVP